MKAKTVLCRSLKPFRRSSSGQALVELAVLMAFGSFLLVFGFGVLEFGKIVYASIEVSNAAMAGAQYASLSGNTAGDTTGIQNAAAAAAPDLSGLTATSSFGCICSDGTSSDCGTSSCSSSHIEETVTVNTSATVTPLIQTRLFPSSFTLTGQAIQKCLQ